MSLQTWYWLILIIALIFGFGEWFIEDPRWRRGGNIITVILFIIIGLLIAGSPIK